MKPPNHASAPSSSAQSAIFLFAHPDDEFAVYPLLAMYCAAGRRVTCIYLTDGGWGGQDRIRRQAESRHVLAALGVNDVRFTGDAWAIPDGALHEHLARVVPMLIDEMVWHSDIDLYVPAWEGGHQDHDATHLVGISLSQHSGSCLHQFSLYHGAGLPGPLFRVLAPLSENGRIEPVPAGILERARSVARCLTYRSQWRSFIGLLPFYVLRMFSRCPFSIQPVDLARTSGPPHSGKLLYERRGGPTWEDFAFSTRHWRAN